MQQHVVNLIRASLCPHDGRESTAHANIKTLGSRVEGYGVEAWVRSVKWPGQ
jgi:hypothetical protein